MDFYYYSTILGSEWLTACLRSTTWSVFVRLPSPAVARSLSGMDIRDMYEPLEHWYEQAQKKRKSALAQFITLIPTNFDQSCFST